MTDILAGNTNPNDQPVLGQVRDHGRRRTASRRRSRPARTTTPRTSTPTATSRRRRADGAPPASTRSPSASGTATRDNTPSSRRRGPAGLLDRRRRPTSGRASSPRRGQVADRRTSSSRPTASSRPRSTRGPGLRPSTGGQCDRRVVHRRHRAEGAVGPTRAASTSSRAVNVETELHDWMKADRDWLRRARNADPAWPAGPDRNRDDLLLQRRVPPVRPIVGRARRGARLRPAEPVANLLPGADAGRERRDPVVRDPDPGRARRRRRSPARPRARRRRRRRRPSAAPSEPPPTEHRRPTSADPGADARADRRRPTPTPTPRPRRLRPPAASRRAGLA